jgi:hypothetical protein
MYEVLCDKAITLENTVKQVKRKKIKHDKHGSDHPTRCALMVRAVEALDTTRMVTMRVEIGTNTATDMFTTTMAIKISTTRGKGSHNGGHNGNNHNN